MKIIPFYYDDYDDLFANSYIVIDEDNNCIIIDPSKDYDGLIKYIEKNSLTPKAILLTHGHYDHIRGVERLINYFSIPYYISFDEVDLLFDPYKNCSKMMSSPYVIDKKPITISDKEILKILKEDILCIATPFHTKGSMCFYFKDSKILFSGDSLFIGSVGRSDLPTGNIRDFPNSIRKIINLDDETIIYPGHGEKTNLKAEKKFNYYLKNI